MTWIRILSLSRCLVGLLLNSCHDAPRKNPFDPTLTPSVELSVELDDATGTAMLAWTPYAGKADFAAYRVLRNIFESTRIDTLHEITDPRQTAYTDTTLQPNTSYVYQVCVVNTDGFEQSSDPKRIDGYATGAVRLLPTDSPSATGITNLTWTRYRLPCFESYQVHRRTVGTDQDPVLTIITDVGDTTFADTSALHEVDYLYRVVVSAAGQQLPSNFMDGRLTLTGVTITHAKFSSPTASCSLAWTPYAGPRFRAYEVRRHLEGIETKILDVINDRNMTHFIDSGLHGNKEYTYQILVSTEADEEIASQEHSGRFHHRVAEWPLEMAGMAAARLHATESGRIEALVSSEDEVRLLVFDTEGALLEEQILYVRDYISLGTAPRITPQSVCTELGPDGQRFLTLARTDQMVMVVVFTLGGEVITRDTTLFDMALPEGVPPEGEIALRVPTAIPAGFEQSEVIQNSYVQFDNVDVYASGQTVLQEDFDEEMAGDWEVNYASVGTNPAVAEGRLWFACTMSGRDAGPVRRSDPSWRELGVQVGMSMSAGAAGIVTVGQGDGRSVWFWLIERFDTARLQVVQADFDTTTYEVPFELWQSAWYRMGLWVQDGRVTASVGEPFLWIEEQEEAPRWGSMAVVEDFVAFTSDQQRHTISVDGDMRQSEQASSATCDMRVWGSGRDRQIAMCLPDEHRILIGKLGVSTWNPRLNFPIDGATTSVVLGKGAGLADGLLLLPLSVDRGLDGRYYVLDAGNSRIQVFDAEGEYLTQWGTRGEDPGQFNFGTGHDLGKFAGSICVDDEGYIYVADVFNHRVQKFTP